MVDIADGVHRRLRAFAHPRFPDMAFLDILCDAGRSRMTIASNLGFPRIGARRELKFALERFLGGQDG